MRTIVARSTSSDFRLPQRLDVTDDRDEAKPVCGWADEFKHETNGDVTAELHFYASFLPHRPRIMELWPYYDSTALHTLGITAAPPPPKCRECGRPIEEY